MIIAVNCISAKMGGMLTLTHNLISSLAEHPEHTFHFWVPADFEGVETPNIYLHKSIATRFGFLRRLLYDQFGLKHEILEAGAELLYSAANFGIITRKFPQLLLVHNSGFFNRLFLETLKPDFSMIQKVGIFLRRHLCLITARFCDRIMFPSESMNKDFLRFAPKLESRCIVNRFGINRSEFRVAQRARGTDSDIRLLYLSVYSSNKNPGIIAEAMKILTAAQHPVTARITMDMESALSRSFPRWQLDYLLLADRDVKDFIQLGQVSYPEVPALLAAADIFVFPSIDESFGYPLVEAMAAGLPIVAADIPITHEICGAAALYFDPFSAEELADKILTVHHNRQVCENLVAAGKQSLISLRWEDHIKRLLEIMDDFSR